MLTQSPYEQIKFIRDVIKDRNDKSQPTFFSVELESFGNLTPLVEKENGALFYDTLLQYLTRYDVAAIVVKLYHGKSHNIKEPFQTFRIVLKKSPSVSLNGIEKNEALTTHSEQIISPEKHFQTISENNFNLLRLQYENDVLKKKNKKKKNYIKELEAQIETLEKEKKGGLGNVALGSVASNAIENFAKSNFGLAILKNVFGAKDEVLQGLLGPGNGDPAQMEGPSSKASIIKEEPKELTEEQRIRKQILDSINLFLQNTDDSTIRLYYELMRMMGSDLKILQAIYSYLRQYYAKKEQEPKNEPAQENKQESEAQESKKPPPLRNTEWVNVLHKVESEENEELADGQEQEEETDNTS